MKDFAAGLATIFTAILLLAFVSVIVSKQSQTASVIQAIATAMAKVIQAAVTPVTAAGQSAQSSQAG
jgi:hypothetical protein